MCHRILAVDDDPETTHGLKRFLEAHGYMVREENDPTKALDVAKESCGSERLDYKYERGVSDEGFLR